MGEGNVQESLAAARADFEKLMSEIRPELHRYCARMTGSVVDGEDIVQETLAKAFYLLAQTADIGNLRSWIFRIAHNKAVDFCRAYDRRFGAPLDNDLDIADSSPPIESQQLTKMGLALFVKLTPAQRGAVILKDVLEYSLTEVAEILEISIASVKGALHRGRVSLRKLSSTARKSAPPLDRAEAALLDGYVRHFVARDFDRLREMLARDVRLDVVGVSQGKGAKQFDCYFSRYSEIDDWNARLGAVEGRQAILVFTRESFGKPSYFILIDWVNDEIASIRDYRHANYIMADAEFTV